MNIDQLSADEKKVLLGLMREVVQADGEYSDEERAEVAKLEADLGSEDFIAAMTAAKEEFTSREKLQAAVKSVTRNEAKKAIFSRLVSMAASDGVDDSEEAPLKWLARVWPDSIS